MPVQKASPPRPARAALWREQRRNCSERARARRARRIQDRQRRLLACCSNLLAGASCRAAARTCLRARAALARASALTRCPCSPRVARVAMAAAPSTANLACPPNVTEFAVTLECVEQGVGSIIFDQCVMPTPGGAVPGFRVVLDVPVKNYVPGAGVMGGAARRDDIALQAARHFRTNWRDAIPELVRGCKAFVHPPLCPDSARVVTFYRAAHSFRGWAAQRRARTRRGRAARCVLSTCPFLAPATCVATFTSDTTARRRVRRRSEPSWYVVVLRLTGLA